MSGRRPLQRRLNKYDSWSEVEDSQDEESLEDKRHKYHIGESETDVSTQNGSKTETETETETDSEMGSNAQSGVELESDDAEVKGSDGEESLGDKNHTPDPEWHVIMKRRRQKAEARALAAAVVISNPPGDDNTDTLLANELLSGNRADNGEEEGADRTSGEPEVETVATATAIVENGDMSSCEEVRVEIAAIGAAGDKNASCKALMIEGKAIDDGEESALDNEGRGSKKVVGVVGAPCDSQQTSLAPSTTKTKKRRQAVETSQSCSEEMDDIISIKIRRSGSLDISVKRRRTR
ncbi:hypothetical protein BJ165DRAFT_1532062 [Panaeolus papilionaceus]|nr:hypothetical protein BJ165DRAFT_1532062 [Panaeolus papilionaceus]